jgi:hypothetical protein
LRPYLDDGSDALHAHGSGQLRWNDIEVSAIQCFEAVDTDGLNLHPYFAWTNGWEFESLELKYFWAADLGKYDLLHTILPRALAIQSVPGCRAQTRIIDGDVSDDECAFASPNLLDEQVNSGHYK